MASNCMNEQEGGLSVHTQAGKEIVLGEEEPLLPTSPELRESPSVPSALCSLSTSPLWAGRNP